MTRKNIGFVAWVALIIAMISFAFGFAAFNRTSSWDERLELTLIEGRQDTRESIAIAEARLRLITVRTRLAAEESYENAAQEVRDIRNDLRESFEGAGQQARQQWQALDTDLEMLESQLRQGSAESLLTLEETIGNMSDALQPGPQQMCEASGGTWREFPNSCADSCQVNRNPEVTSCAQVLTMGCDCGDDMCWNGQSCVQI